MSSKKFLAALPLAAMCAFMPHHSSAQEQQQGMVVVRDAQTGQLRAPTPAEARALAPKPTSSLTTTSKPSMITHPSGARQVRLGERGLVYSVVTRDSDGKLAEQCVHGAAAADQAVHQHGQHDDHGKQAGHDKEGRHETK
ncbi:post-PEP-CTERM-1 domain-containing protein [Telluria sp. B2]